MFNLGLPELLVIGGAVLLLFGPKRLPEFAKSLGKGIRDFKKALEGNGEEKDEKTAETEVIPPAVQDPGAVVRGSTDADKSETKPR